MVRLHLNSKDGIEWFWLPLRKALVAFVVEPCVQGFPDTCGGTSSVMDLNNQYFEHPV